MKERITPEQVVRHHAKLCGIRVEDIVIAPLLIVSWMKPALERIARMLDCSPYKEYMHVIDGHQRDGVLGVDMETSAMYALAAHRKVRSANVLVVSDELWQDWNPAFGTPQLDRATDAACDLVVSFVKRDSGQ